MFKKAHGQLRRGQIITTYGPGALIDLPRYSAIVGGLDTWPSPSSLQEIEEPRLTEKLRLMTGVKLPRLFAPPPAPRHHGEPNLGIVVWRFPEWFVVQDEGGGGRRQKGSNVRSRRLVHRKALDDKGRFDGREVVATRFVRACPKGHIDDIDWYSFVHGPDDRCRQQLWLDERGTTGDLGDLVVRCECGKQRPMYEAASRATVPLGYCRGSRPWLGHYAWEECKLPSRLLVRTASNAYFPQVVSVLALPDRGSEAQKTVQELWDDLQIVESESDLAFIKKKPQVAEALERFSDEEVLAAIREIRAGGAPDRPVKQVELDALLAAPEGYGEDAPIDPDFHARRLPQHVWRRSDRFPGIESVVQLHRLREVVALIGFTRLEPVMRDIQGEYDLDVERAPLALEPQWFPAVENRGEGLFIQLGSAAVHEWLQRPAVRARIADLEAGHRRWLSEHNADYPFHGGPYVLLHTLSHLLIQSMAMQCGYPASSIRERIYVDPDKERYGIMLHTGSPDAEGTLGGLVQQARYIEEHLANALRAGALCSNDPICAQHKPGHSLEERWHHGAACHGCALISETSCEMRNEYLDRALVVPILDEPDAAFFQAEV